MHACLPGNKGVSPEPLTSNLAHLELQQQQQREREQQEEVGWLALGTCGLFGVRFNQITEQIELGAILLCHLTDFDGALNAAAVAAGRGRGRKRWVFRPDARRCNWAQKEAGSV
eukprot:1160788-Pelagomonas_calceolata.AAC.9